MNPERVPPVTVTSANEKLVVGSLRVKEIVAVSPALRVALLEVIAMVGATVSITIWLVSDPAVLLLPAASVKAFAATETLPAAVEFALGVKVAE
jgi:hypothetical protein